MRQLRPVTEIAGRRASAVRRVQRWRAWHRRICGLTVPGRLDTDHGSRASTCGERTAPPRGAEWRRRTAQRIRHSSPPVYGHTSGGSEQRREAAVAPSFRTSFGTESAVRHRMRLLRIRAPYFAGKRPTSGWWPHATWPNWLANPRERQAAR